MAKIAEVTADAACPWWIIGSAAVALHGAQTTVRDVDLLMDVSDARHLLQRLGISSAPDTHHPQFRSSVFGIWRETPLPVEIFAGFSIATRKGWHPIELRTQDSMEVAGLTVFVPSRHELKDLLLSFGRKKDVERAHLLACP